MDDFQVGDMIQVNYDDIYHLGPPNGEIGYIIYIEPAGLLHCYFPSWANGIGRGMYHINRILFPRNHVCRLNPIDCIIFNKAPLKGELIKVNGDIVECDKIFMLSKDGYDFSGFGVRLKNRIVCEYEEIDSIIKQKKHYNMTSTREIKWNHI